MREKEQQAKFLLQTETNTSANRAPQKVFRFLVDRRAVLIFRRKSIKLGEGISGGDSDPLKPSSSLEKLLREVASNSESLLRALRIFSGLFASSKELPSQSAADIRCLQLAFNFFFHLKFLGLREGGGEMSFCDEGNTRHTFCFQTKSGEEKKSEQGPQSRHFRVAPPSPPLRTTRNGRWSN